jgi:hypothetical protein
MEKLTIEHLAPYLPYRLQMKCNDGRFRTLDAISNSYKKTISYSVILNSKEVYWKPLLIPLSEFKMNTGYETLSLSVNDMDGMPYTTVIKLISQLYDVFGLIDKGLALNKNNFK